MSRTFKDARRGNVLEITKREDDTFDVFLNRSLDQAGIDEDDLMGVLCVRFGYCGPDFQKIIDELIQNGRAVRYPN
jgi:hypothetical protein